MRIEEVEFVIFDTETTGLEPESGDRIVEIAAVRIRGDQRLASFQTLVNPGRTISEGAFRVNKISDAMLISAPPMEKIIPSFLEFIQGACLCSYNAGFDMGFLNNELRLAGRPELTGITVVDALKMSRRLLPGLERYALWFVAESLDISTKQEHRAFSDVELTIGVFNKLLQILDAKGIRDFSSFTGLFGLNAGFDKDALRQKIVEVQRAIDQKLTLKIKYLSASGGGISEREVTPRLIRQENNQAYLIGYCSLRREERTFRIDGILHLEAV